eukprot:285031_1
MQLLIIKLFTITTIIDIKCYIITHNNNKYNKILLQYYTVELQKWCAVGQRPAIMKSRTPSSYNSMLSQHQTETTCNGRTISPSHIPTIYVTSQTIHPSKSPTHL